MSGTYTITEDNGITFLAVVWNNTVREKYLVLTSSKDGVLLLYKNNGAPFFRGCLVNDNYGSQRIGFGNNKWVRASSSLTEGRITYSTGKLGSSIGECWVEGAEGYGINERLTLDLSSSYGNIYVSSGFVSFEKPYLYRENCRIKKLRISNKSGTSIVVALRDTPHFQEIDLSAFGGHADRSEIYMDILEVYPGTKYADTCLNALYCHVAAQ